MPLKITRSERGRCLLLILLIGSLLFVYSLGSTGLFDETPPLFAAAGRNMSSSGDWITPKVNGLNRFDKPPLIYWIMGVFYSLPGHNFWDPLGTWAARLPSALSSIFMMLFLADTLLTYPQKYCVKPQRTAIVTALAFALSPLVIIWSRIAVSDALLTATFGISMLQMWRRYSYPSLQSWWSPWLTLGISILAKGPVSLVLMLMTFVIFGIHQREILQIWTRTKPLKGLALTALVSLPWYIIEYVKEGKAFWDSFFGYHNFQRFTSVVNSHLEPWWFFILILIIASLPFTAFLFYGLVEYFISFGKKKEGFKEMSENSLIAFAGSWFISVFILFTCAATKLPSYWLPATPAAAILIGIASSYSTKKNHNLQFYAWISSVLTFFSLAIAFWLSPYWTLSIRDPEIPGLGVNLSESDLLQIISYLLTLGFILGLIFLFKYRPDRLIILQIPMVLFYILGVIPLVGLGDKLRQLPLRNAADLVLKSQKKNEALAMVGPTKPSLHFYSRKIILYEGRSARAFVNLTERLSQEERIGWRGRPLSDPNSSSTVLVVIDAKTSNLPYWSGLRPVELGAFGIYKVWRLDRLKLERRAINIIRQGIESDWQEPRPEKF